MTNIKYRARISTILSICFLLVLCLLPSCKDNSSKSETVKKEKNLLLYCGITMIKPMTDICNIIEEQEGCNIVITKGGSGNLMKSILKNKTGDLYFPGSDGYLSQIEQQHPGIITNTIEVGENKAVIFVQKGNPLNLTNDLNQLKDPKYGVVIGNDKSGSIGKETKKILDHLNIYEDVVKNAIILTTDSKDLVKAIRKKEADIVINWYAVYNWDDNNQYMEPIEISKEYHTPKKLVISTLSFSEHKDIAEKILQLAGSKEGKKIFQKYGLNFENLE